MSGRDPVTVAEEWVYRRLAADPAVIAAVGNRIFPAYAPPGTATPYLTHDLIGGDAVVPFAGAPPMAWRLTWEITAWIEGPGRQALRPAVTAALAAVAGDDLAGVPPEPFGSAVDGSRWQMSASYEGPVASPVLAGEITGEGAWSRIGHAIVIEMQPA